MTDWQNSSLEMSAYYHEQWGKPEFNSQKLFEILSFETYQAGLSWQIVFNKRQAFKAAFYDYDLTKVAQMTTAEVLALMKNTNLIRHQAKLLATRNNARAILNLPGQQTLSDFVWSQFDYQPQVNQPTAWQEVPLLTPASQLLAQRFKTAGLTFIGAKTCYSFMQAAGIVDDHLVNLKR